MEVEGCKVITLHIHNLFTLSSYWTGRRQIRRLRQSTRNGVGMGVRKVKCAQCRASLKTIYLCVHSYQQKRWHSESRRNSNKCYKIAVCCCCCCYSNKSYHKVVLFLLFWSWVTARTFLVLWQIVLHMNYIFMHSWLAGNLWGFPFNLNQKCYGMRHTTVPKVQA